MELKCSVDIIITATVGNITFTTGCLFGRGTDDNNRSVDLIFEFCQSQGGTECGSSYPVMSTCVSDLVLVWSVSRKRIILRKYSNFRPLTTVKFCTESSIKIQIRTSYRKSMLF